MVENEVGWKFELSNSGDVEGLNDGGVEAFRDDHLLSLAKESAQNSLDAKKDDSPPVILEFNTFYINQKDFPDIKNYRDIINLQIDYWKKAQKDKSSEEFFKEAKKVLDSKKIFCIRISDFNTVGLEGSKEGKRKPFSRWFKLVRSKGVTDNDALAGGSFGLGKFASFACSRIRTVFYSTRDIRGIESHQGVSILASYDTKKGDRTKGKGYFCNLQDFSCIQGPFQLDQGFRRDSSGTDIYIIGFIDNEKELKEKMFSSILRSFLLAIYNGNLIFRLNGETLEKNNLKKFIDKYREVIYRPYIPQEVIEYYDILEGNLDFEEYSFSMIEKEDISFKIAVNTGLSKKIGVFRNNGMKIFDKKNIRSYNDYSGVLFLKGNKINAYFRKLENPEHDNWRPERLNDLKEVSEAKSKIKKLYDFIIKSLKKLEDKTLPESENMEGIDSLSDDLFEERGITPLEGLDFKPLKVRESKTKRKQKNKIKLFVDGGGRGSGDGRNNSEGGTGGPEPGNVGSSGPGLDNSKKAIVEVIPEKMKIFRDDKGVYHLFFSLPENFESVQLELFIGGEEFNEIVELEKVSIKRNDQEDKLMAKKNIVKIGPIVKNVLNQIQFNIKEDENWTVEANFYENQP